MNAETDFATDRQLELRSPVKRAGGRAGRAARRAKCVASPVIAKRVIPTYELLDEEELQKLEAHADWILKEIGIEFRGDEEALALFRVASATVDGERVRFDPGHAHALCATAPRQFQMLGRDPARTITLGRRSSCVDAQLWAALCQRSKQGPSICNA